MVRASAAGEIGRVLFAQLWTVGERPREVVSDAELSLDDVGFGNRLDDQVMIPDHLLHLAHYRKVQTANAIDVSAPLTDQCVEVGNSCSLEQPVVERAIKRVEFLKFAFVGARALTADSEWAA